VKSHAGTPCWDIADGHATDDDMRENKYWVPINGEWMVVPPGAVASDEGNPTGDAVVWYTMYNGTVYIRYFVPGGVTSLVFKTKHRPPEGGGRLSHLRFSTAGSGASDAHLSQ
jgi:hypothetical protein